MNPQSITTNPSSTMIDGWGRHITYLRLSVTDRCDFRCLYCMKENMSFLSRSQLLTVEEMHKLCEVFIQNGVRKIRITGGEPLVRKDIHQLFEKLAPYVKNKTLHELTLTTNASQLARSASTFMPAVCAALMCRWIPSTTTFSPLFRGADALNRCLKVFIKPWL